MKRIKGLLIILVGLLFLVSCNKGEKVTLTVDKTLNLRVEQEVKLRVNQVAGDLEFSGMDDVITIRTSGNSVYVKGIKEGVVDLKVTYKPNKKITATVKVTVTPQDVGDSYTINFSAIAPEGFAGDIYVLGGFNNWELDNALKLTKGADGKYTGSATYTTTEEIVEYKYFNYPDWDYAEGNEAGEYRDNRQVTLETTLNLEDAILSWEKVYDNGGSGEPQEYTFTFNVTVPEGTEGNVFVAGNFTNWLDEECTPLQLTKGEGNIYSGTVTYTTNKALSYKYINAKDLESISWEYGDIAEENRSLAIADLVANDTVTAWKKGGYKAEAVEKDYTLNFKVTVPFELPEGYKVFVIGSFNSWNEETALELVADGLDYFGETTITTSDIQIEYMVVAGKTFTWDHKPLKEDNSEYGYGENITHDLVDGQNNVEYVVYAWKNLNPTATEKNYTLKFTVTVPEGTEGNVFVVGSFTNWLDEECTPLQLTKGEGNTYSGTVEYKTAAETVKYKYVNAKDLESISWTYGEVISEDRTLVLATPPANDTVTAWEKGGYKEGIAQEMVDVVVRLTSIPTTTETYPIKLIGSMTNNWTVADALVFEKVGEVYETTLTVDKNVENKFAVYLDKEQEKWHDHQAANEGVALPDHIISAAEYTALLVEIAVPEWKGIIPPAPEVEYTLNFSFNISVYIPEGYKVFLIGDFNAWDISTAVELVGEAGLYTYQTTYTTSKTKLEYMILTGEEFTWNHKTLKPDNGEYGDNDNIAHDLIEGVNAISYIVPGWAGITPPTSPEMVDVVVRLTSVPTTTETYPIKLIGSMTNNWTVADALVFEKVGEVYETTLTVDKNVENKFAVYLDKEQEKWHDHQAANEGVALPDHIISAAEYTALLVEIAVPEWKGIIPPAPEVKHTLTFTVTVPEGTEGNVFVVGDFTNWLLEPSTPLLLTKGVGNTYSGTVEHTTSKETLKYKYVNAKDLASLNYDYEEVIEDDRVLTLTTPTANDTVTNWKAGGYFEPANVSVTFDITAPAEASLVCVVGQFNNWGEAENTLDWQLTKSGDKYTLTKDFLVSERNFSLKYKFVVNGYWEDYTGDRSVLLEKNTPKTITNEITGISANKAPETTLPKHTLTFNVTVPEGTEGNVFVAGSFTNWLLNPSTPLQLTKDEGNKYSGTVDVRTLDEAVEYKYVNAKDLASISWEYGDVVEENRSLAIADLVANDTVTAWKKGGYKASTPETEYTLTINLTTPVVPEGVTDIYLLGNINDWGNDANVNDWKLTKVTDTSYTITITFTTTLAELLFKFSNLGWSHVEKDAFGNEIVNRTLTLTTEPMILNLEVAKWQE